MRPLAAKLQQLVDRIDPQAGRYRMLFESSPLPMWVADDETLRFLAVNDAALRVYGYTRREFLAMNASDLRRSDERRDFLRNEPGEPGGTVYRGLYRHRRKNGEPLDIDGVGHLVSWRGRRARLVVINDISERLRTQQALERVNREVELSHERLRALSRRLLEIQEEERGRLARDLHDDIGQALTALKIQLESLQLAGDPGLRARVAEGVETVQHTLERVRQLSLSLRPPQLDDLGLAAALRSHLDRQCRVAGLAAHFDSLEAPQDIEPDTETACFRVAQEAITNVLRHAHAQNLWVRLYATGERLALSIRDDGRGFDLESVRQRAASGASLGLVSMEERIALAAGSLELRSAPGTGTVLVATFPARRQASEQAA
ncbi:MAG TPA: PAS domain-containing sensor histidine kinase [Burkholderiales bacterium]|nr:PAS domain-containing sensor histidine kinase [Burkholderiales bacterium]